MKPHIGLRYAGASVRPRGAASLSLPHSDLCFVESDSDGEWSNNRRVSETPGRRRQPLRDKTTGEGKDASERNERVWHVRSAAAKGVALLMKTHACDVTVKLLWLSVFHGAAPGPAKIFEATTFMGPVIVPLCTALQRASGSEELPQQVHAVAEFLKSCRTPATLSILFRVLKCLAGPRPCRPSPSQNIVLSQLQSDGNHLRDSIGSMTPAIADLYEMSRGRSPSETLELAEIYRSVIHLFKCTLDWQPIEQSRRLSTRFDDTDAEIMRYLIACKILQARTDDDVEHVFRSASRRLQETLIWANTYHFLSDRIIRTRWRELVVWTRRSEDGHPVVLMRLGSAIRTCDPSKADEYGRAIVTQIDRGVRKLLRNDGVDTLVAIVDCDGASATNVNRFYGLLRTVPVVLNKHYPGRLRTLHLVNVPGFVIWLIQLVKRFLHPVTRDKIYVYGHDLTALPPELLEILRWQEERGMALTEGESSQVQ